MKCQCQPRYDGGDHRCDHGHQCQFELRGPEPWSHGRHVLYAISPPCCGWPDCAGSEVGCPWAAPEEADEPAIRPVFELPPNTIADATPRCMECGMGVAGAQDSGLTISLGQCPHCSGWCCGRCVTQHLARPTHPQKINVEARP